MATISKSLTVAAKSAYSLAINVIPTGSSATPANDIQTWLHCADIWDKTYTTISQVLNDASTLQALIASNNAADYMARSTNWASSVCGNQTAMGYIGNNDYCASKLLTNSTWVTAICDSTYFESVLNVKVPTMTSDTTPSGTVIYSGQYDAVDHAAFRAFDKDTSNTYNWEKVFASGDYIGYVFTQAISVKKLYFLNPFRDSTVKQRIVKNFKLQGSNNGSSWTDIASFTMNQVETQTFTVASSNTKYTRYRIYITSNYGNSYVNIKELQFYGRA